MNIPTIRTALGEAMAGIPGLRTYANVPDTPIVPCVIIFPERITFRETFAPAPVSSSTFIVHVLAASTTNRAGQELLDAYVSDNGGSSLIAAIETDTTLGGVVHIAEVAELRNYGTIELVEGGVRYYSAQLVVNIYAS